MESIFQAILHMQTPFNMVVLVVMITCSAAVVKFIAMELRKFGCHRQDIDFKREMVDRGLSAEEIERILKAGSSDAGGTPTTVNVGNYVHSAQGEQR
jgi:hypothetical protein